MTLRSDERVRAAYSIAPKERSGCSWCNDTGEVGPLEDRYVCPCPAGELMQLKSKVRAGGVERTPEKFYRVSKEAITDVVHYETAGLESDMETVVLFCIECRLKFPKHTQDCRSRMAREAVEPPAQEPR